MPDLAAVPGGGSGGEGSDSGRGLPGDGLSPQVRGEASERPCSREAAAPASASWAELWQVGGSRAAPGVGGGELPVVGEAEGTAAAVAAVAQEAHLDLGAAGEPTAADQPPPDRPSARALQGAGEETALRQDQTGDSAQAPDSHQGGTVGGEPAWLHGDRSGVALGGSGRGRVHPLPHPDRHPHRLDGDSGCHGQEPSLRGGGA